MRPHKLTNMKAKALFILTLLAFATLAVSSCSKEDTPVAPIDPELEALLAQGGQPLAEAPADWVAQTEADVFPKSMLVLIDQDGLPAPIAEGDMLSAWVNGTCRAVSTPLFGTEGYNRFQFKVSLPTKLVTQGNNYVELRYYNAKHQLLFTAQPVLFAEDTQLGEYMKGYKPEWKK